MKILQVKKYHETVSRRKEQKSKENKCYSPKSMFYFMKEDEKGYPTEERKNGYVAFNDNQACFGLSREKAIKRFNRY
jgi:hypothetical protein